jgi:hypothetical protein
MWAVAIFLIIFRQFGKQSCPRLEVVALLCLFADRYEHHYLFPVIFDYAHSVAPFRQVVYINLEIAEKWYRFNS